MTNEKIIISPVADLFSNYVNMSHLTQREICKEAGYRKANIITMFKTGETRIPIEKIPVFANILGIDSRRFLRTALKEYMPSVLETIEHEYGAMITQNEADIINVIREASDDNDPKLTPDQIDSLREFVKNLLGK